MPFGKPKTRKLQTENLPGPIATSYRRIFTRHDPDVERLMFVLDTAEITARFLAAVLLCTLRELAAKGKIDRPLVDLGDAATRLKKPSFGMWMEILREGARRLHGKPELFDDDEAAGELASHVVDYVFNQQQKSKGRPYASLEGVLVIRNKVHHPAEELQIPTLCEEAEKLLHESLEPLQFFEEFTLYVVKQINLRQRRLSDAEYDHQCFLLQGEIDFPTAASDARDWFTETSDVLIYRSEQSYLNLDPMFIFLHADELDSGAGEVYPGMYCYSGYARKSAGTVVEYLPCSGGAKSFRTSAAAFRDEQVTQVLNRSVDELLDLLSKAPEAPAEETAPQPAEP